MVGGAGKERAEFSGGTLPSAPDNGLRATAVAAASNARAGLLRSQFTVTFQREPTTSTMTTRPRSPTGLTPPPCLTGLTPPPRASGGPPPAIPAPFRIGAAESSTSTGTSRQRGRPPRQSGGGASRPGRPPRPPPAATAPGITAARVAELDERCRANNVRTRDTFASDAEFLAYAEPIRELLFFRASGSRHNAGNRASAAAAAAAMGPRPTRGGNVGGGFGSVQSSDQEEDDMII